MCCVKDKLEESVPADSQTITTTQDYTYILRSGVKLKINDTHFVTVASVSTTEIVVSGVLPASLSSVEVADTQTSNLCLSDFVPAVSLGTRSNLRLTYPYVTPTLTVDLRNPLFGNIKRIDTQFIIHVLRSKELKIFRPSNRNTVEILLVSFNTINIQLIEDFITFLTTSAGKEIGLLDQENRQWQGVITSPLNNIVDVGPGDCNFEINFKFQGTLVT